MASRTVSGLQGNSARPLPAGSTTRPYLDYTTASALSKVMSPSSSTTAMHMLQCTSTLAYATLEVVVAALADGDLLQCVGPTIRVLCHTIVAYSATADVAPADDDA